MYYVVGAVLPDAAINDCSIDSVGLRKQFTLLCFEDILPYVILLNMTDKVIEPANRPLLTLGKELCLFILCIEYVLELSDSCVVVSVVYETLKCLSNTILINTVKDCLTNQIEYVTYIPESYLL